mmetsp:Transcript_21118/g.35227  ORF Transcript_21118/g.35227 Transcript_21118/m.35227 type:complete len:95 (-) Transcript_21118:75-359(-)
MRSLEFGECAYWPCCGKYLLWHAMGGVVLCRICFLRLAGSSTHRTVPFAYRNWWWEKTCAELRVDMIFIGIVWRIGCCREDTLLRDVLCAVSLF